MTAPIQPHDVVAIRYAGTGFYNSSPAQVAATCRHAHTAYDWLEVRLRNGQLVRVLPKKDRTPQLGTEVGEVCGRDGCAGVLVQVDDGYGCSCHLAPPCSHCMSKRPACTTCGYDLGAPE